jgi:hypothetical protein
VPLGHPPSTGEALSALGRVVLVTALAVVIPLTIVKLLRPKESTPPAPAMVFTPLPEPDAKTKQWLADLESTAEEAEGVERLKKEAKERPTGPRRRRPGSSRRLTTSSGRRGRSSGRIEKVRDR